jgi:hypothetical protein
MMKDWNGWPLRWTVVNSLDQVVGAFTGPAEANACAAFRGGEVMPACECVDCPNAALAVADIGDGEGWRNLCAGHIFDRARIVEGSESELQVA